MKILRNPYLHAGLRFLVGPLILKDVAGMACEEPALPYWWLDDEVDPGELSALDWLDRELYQGRLEVGLHSPG